MCGRGNALLPRRFVFRGIKDYETFEDLNTTKEEVLRIGYKGRRGCPVSNCVCVYAYSERGFVMNTDPHHALGKARKTGYPLYAAVAAAVMAAFAKRCSHNFLFRYNGIVLSVTRPSLNTTNF